MLVYKICTLKHLFILFIYFFIFYSWWVTLNFVSSGIEDVSVDSIDKEVFQLVRVGVLQFQAASFTWGFRGFTGGFCVLLSALLVQGYAHLFAFF